MSAATTHTASHASPKQPGVRLGPQQLWDRHGTSLFAMACTLLGSEDKALRAVTQGLVDLYRLPEDGPPAEEALRSASARVYRHCQPLTPGCSTQ